MTCGRPAGHVVTRWTEHFRRGSREHRLGRQVGNAYVRVGHSAFSLRSSSRRSTRRLGPDRITPTEHALLTAAAATWTDFARRPACRVLYMSLGDREFHFVECTPPSDGGEDVPVPWRDAERWRNRRTCWRGGRMSTFNKMGFSVPSYIHAPTIYCSSVPCCVQFVLRSVA